MVGSKNMRVLPANTWSTNACLDWGLFRGHVSGYVAVCFEVWFDCLS